jgi:hypothetical protein
MKHKPWLLALALAALASTPSGAQQQAAAAAVPGAAPYNKDDPWIWGDVALLRGLDKVTAETRDFEAPVGQDVEFFALTVSVKRCAKRPPEVNPPETIVGMEISNRRTDGAGAEAVSERIFSGWMFGSSPALNPLEHPVYDVWVLDCWDSRTHAAEVAAAAREPDRPAVLPEGPAPGEVLD